MLIGERARSAWVREKERKTSASAIFFVEKELLLAKKGPKDQH
jgi:hypothetical protein